MRVTIRVEGPWLEILENVARRMRAHDYEEVFGRSLALADAITGCLTEPGSTVSIESPRSGRSQLDTSPLYGGRGLPPGTVLNSTPTGGRSAAH